MAHPTRYSSLDGLRGVCALVVVVYHCLLVLPAMSIPADGSAPSAAADAPTWSLVWWLYRTPLRVCWAGPEAVLVFFVLSGFVLCLPRTGSSARPWPRFYARRFCRLYLPVWGAVAFALVIALLIGRGTDLGSEWIRGHQPPTVSALLHDLSLVFGTSTVDGPLWSLRWEIWFSLLLPVLYPVVVRLRTDRCWPATILLLAAFSAFAGTDVRLRNLADASYLWAGLLRYLPVFGIGMVMALNVTDLRRCVRRLAGSRTRCALLSLLAGVLVVSPGYQLPALPAQLLSLLGVALVVGLALANPSWASALGRRPLQWAGSRSFSIYLIHEPLIVGAALLTGASTPWPWLPVAAVTVALVLPLAAGFHRLVERPAHRLSARLGRSTLASKGAPEPADRAA